MTRHLLLILALILIGCSTPKPSCDQPETYYNSQNPDLWPHCEVGK